MSFFPTDHRACVKGMLVLIAALLLGACSTDETERSQDPTFFGSASGNNGGAGATSGMSIKW